jgi:dienelactone hydrolase
VLAYILDKEISMRRIILFICVLAGIFSQAQAIASSNRGETYESKILVFKSTNRGGVKPLVALVATPINARGQLPVIITHHGSSRDGMTFSDGVGRTDEYSTRLIKQGTKRGFVVVAPDEFYETDIQPNEKTKFPNSYRYILDLKKKLGEDQRFDKNNFFFTGFSFGAGQVGKAADGRFDYQTVPWRAVAAAEPGCNVISQPADVKFPVLLIKGDESHYYVEPCQYFERLLLSAEIDVTLTVIRGANHFFSSNGVIRKGKE